VTAALIIKRVHFAFFRVIKRRHPKQLEEFSVKILMKWMLSVEHFDFRGLHSQL